MLVVITRVDFRHLLSIFVVPQIRIVAYDSCNPAQKAVAFVRVTVVRNENKPGFLRGQYNTEIEETQPLGAEILRLEARDEDKVWPTFDE